MNERPAHAYTAPAAVRVFAKLVSYLLHPLFIPTYVFISLAYLYPYDFLVAKRPFSIMLLTTFWMTAFFPAFSVFLLYKLKFIESIFLRTQRDRIAPYIITMVFYWWMWYLSKNLTDQPSSLKIFFLGIFLATPVALILNNFMKISMHAIAVGSAAMFMIILGFSFGLNSGFPIAVAILVAGIVCTARLVLNHHDNAEVYAGLILGTLSQMLAAWVTFY